MRTKFYFAVFTVAALALTSCSQDETLKSADNVQREMKFESYVGKAPITRGTDKTSFKELDKIGLAAYDTQSDAADQEYALNNSLAGSPTTLTFGTGNLSASPSLYWPTNSAHYVQFYAWYPQNAINTLAATNQLTINSNIDNQTDYVFARTQSNFKSATGGVVSLTFKHVLAKLNVKAILSSDLSTAGATVTVTGLTIGEATNNFKSAAELTVTGNSTGEPTCVVKSSATVLDPWVLTPNQVITATENTSAHDLAGNLFLAPETLTNYKITVDYSVDYGNNVTNTLTATATIASFELVQNKFTTVTLVLPVSSNQIKFIITTDIANWGSTGSEVNNPTI